MSQALDRLRQSLFRGGSTQLGIGPMSLECVDATIELANSLRVPLMLIASRRQIDSSVNGGGYVNGWSTESFAEYVRERDKGGYVVLCRDHGGPWQNYREVEEKLSLEAAMKASKEAFRVDIEAGFDVIHIDPSVDIHNPQLRQQDVLKRAFELCQYCADIATQLGKEIAIEIGAEEQTGLNQDMERLTDTLDQTEQFCISHALTRPLFVVGQTGTLVKETDNIGTFDDPFRKDGSLPPEIQIPKLIDLCRKFNVHLKEHNGDYLSNEALFWHPRLGIHAVNVAPEFGVGQTRHILRLCDELGLKEDAERFLQIAFESGRWKKWMRENSTATDRERAIIAGHYIYDGVEFQEIAARIRNACERRGLDFDRSVRDALKVMILRIMVCLNLTNEHRTDPIR